MILCTLLNQINHESARTVAKRVLSQERQSSNTIRPNIRTPNFVRIVVNISILSLIWENISSRVQIVK